MISGNEEALEILKEAFCVSVLDDESVLEHLLQIRHVSLAYATLRFRFRTVAKQFLACCRQWHMPALRCSRPPFHGFSLTPSSS